MRVGSLFSGCLGLDLGLEAAGFETAWVCENDRQCQEIIAARRPHLKIHPDVRELGEVEPVDVLAGGFPCQDLSYAGRGKGLEGDRSGLWFSYADAIRALRPRHVLVENVPGLATRGLGRVLYDLAEAGYVGSWIRLRASDVGAPHGRERIFILASDAERGPERRARSEEVSRASGQGEGEGPEREWVRADVGDGDGSATDAVSVRVDADGRVCGGSAGESNGSGGGDARCSPGDRQDGWPVAARSAVATADADGAGRGEHRGAVAVRAEHATVERGGEALADSDGEPGQSGGGWRAQGGDHPRAGAEERDGRGHDGASERGATVETLADSDESGVEAWGDEGRDGERPRVQPLGSAASARGRGATTSESDGYGEATADDAQGWESDDPGRGGRGEPGGQGKTRAGGPAAADTSGRGFDGSEADEGSRDFADWQAAIGGEGERASGDGVGFAADADERRQSFDAQQDGRRPRVGEGKQACGNDADGRDVAWGTYEPAVRQWERIFGRRAPRPTDDRGRLSPEFVEWMLGFPEGWTDGVPRTARLRMLGNAVQVQCGTVVGNLLRELAS